MSDNTVHSCANGITRLVHQDASVVTKTDNSPINALHLLLDAHNHGMSNISATNLVGKSSTGAFGAGGPLLLNDNDYTVPDCCGALLFQDVDALDDRGAGVVDTV